MKLVLEDLTDAQIASILALLGNEEGKVQKWEPKGGELWIDLLSNSVNKGDSSAHSRTAGLEYQTQEQAEQALKSIRGYVRQLSWLVENNDGWVVDWDDDEQRKYYVFLNHVIKKNTRTFIAGVVTYLPQ